MQKKIYIIGAGLSGLSAAYHLVESGHTDIEIFESSPNTGGRCRSYFDEKIKAEIDNGNHLILGANTNILQMIRKLGVEDRFNKFKDNIFTFFDNRNNQRYYYKAPFPDIEKYGILNFLNLIKFILIPSRKTVKEALKYSPNIYYKLINPIARSILNTSSDIADSNILRRTFLKILLSKDGFHYYYPKINWDNAFISPLVAYLQNNGVKINYHKTLKGINSSQTSVEELVFDKAEKIDTKDSFVILAVPAYAASKIVNINMPDEFSAIVNVHFRLNHSLPPQVIAVINSNIEWLFVKPETLSTTYSAAKIQMSEFEIAKDAWAVCSKMLGIVLQDNKMPEYRVLIEKRATFSATREQLQKRPPQKTQYDNLLLCGDYVDNGLPATIEGAVASGKNIVKLIG